MNFTIPDIQPPASGSPNDMGVRATRATGSSGSAGGRKSFSTVLQGVREDGGRADTRSVDDGRSTSKADQKTRSTDAREQSSSSSHSERTDGTTSQSRPADEARTSDATEGDSKDSRTDLATPAEQGRGGSDVQGGTSESLSPVMTPQAVAQAITQTEVRMEGEDFFTTEEPAHPAQPSSDPLAQSHTGLFTARTDSPGAKNSSLTMEDSAETPALTSDAKGAQHVVPNQASDAPEILSKTGTAPVPTSEPGFSVTGKAAAPEMTTRPEARPAPPDSPLRSPLSQMDATGSGSAPIQPSIQAEAMVAGGKPESAKADSLFREAIPFDRMASPEVSQDEPPLREHQDTGGRTIPVALYGQGATPEEDGQFPGFSGDQKSTQHDQQESKPLQQPAVVDRQILGAQPTESMMVGAHGRTVVSPPPPAPSNSGAPVSPAVPTHHIEPLAQGMTRSVVFNVAQPDIGQVNIRVALTNEIVHTHLSADRPEVGQFFINGQDRLQAAFQASGLDMGQFRVDIDRQGAGRSFYQGSSQEQGQSWNQGAQGQGTSWEQGAERRDEQRSSLHGLLNVVA